MTSTSGGYTAAYGTAGNMVCRAPTSAATCTGSSQTGWTGQGLSYDNEGQLSGWTSALHGQPTPSTASFAYDGEGSRVAMQTTNGALQTTTTTDYLLGGLEESQVSAGGRQVPTTLTEYYPLPGIGTAVRVSTSSSSTLSYLASDGLGSVTVALSTSGTATARALYSPYGTVRYASGQMPTAHGYTGQLADAMTGLSYYGARYYDPALGQFTSADTDAAGGLNRYAYVGGNPTTRTDPSGHEEWDEDTGGSGGGGGDAGSLESGDDLEWGLDVSGGAAGAGGGEGVDITLSDGSTIELSGNADGTENAVIQTADGGYADVTGATDAQAAETQAEEAAGESVSAGEAGVGTPEEANAAEEDAARADSTPHTATSPTTSTTPTSPTAPTNSEPTSTEPMATEPTATEPTTTEPTGTEGNGTTAEDGTPEGCGESFAPGTLVATLGGGAQPISSLRVGDAVEAYDPATGTTSVQTVQRVFVNHDTDLLDVTLRTSVSVTQTKPEAKGQAHGHVPQEQRGQQSAAPDTADTQATETIHTTANHPWLTADHGWEQAGVLRVGEPVVTADGVSATVIAIRVVPGSAAMWDLTVSTVHTFAVGAGQFVVHNCDDPEGQVKWGETDLSNYAKETRQDFVDANHNYAAARLDNGEIWIGRSTADYHAEEFLVDEAEDEGRTIDALYSERQPCPDCAEYLMDHNPAMKISWTWPWERSDPGLSAEIARFIRGEIK